MPQKNTFDNYIEENHALIDFLAVIAKAVSSFMSILLEIDFKCSRVLI